MAVAAQVIQMPDSNRYDQFVENLETISRQLEDFGEVLKLARRRHKDVISVGRLPLSVTVVSMELANVLGDLRERRSFSQLDEALIGDLEELVVELRKLVPEAHAFARSVFELEERLSACGDQVA